MSTEEQDRAASQRVRGIVKWLRDRAEKHAQRAGQLGGVGYPSGAEADTRARECRAVADKIEEFWT